MHQPWAHAILYLGKDVENRGWATSYRGPLLIHASRRRLPSELLPEHEPLPQSAVVGVVELTDVRRDMPSEWAQPGQYHWVLDAPRVLPEPVPTRGYQGLWRVRPEVVERVAAQLQ